MQEYPAVIIADDCTVGANTVVTRDINEIEITIAGVPAKSITITHIQTRFVLMVESVADLYEMLWV